MKFGTVIIFCVGLLFLTNVFAEDAASTPAKPDKTVWKFTFHDVSPARADVSKGFCKNHTPDKFTTSIDNLAQNGMVAKNSVMVKYKNFTNASKYGLFFTEITATISGITDGKQWQNEMYIQQQRLEPTGETIGVWSTPDCKGWVTSEVD